MTRTTEQKNKAQNTTQSIQMCKSVVHSEPPAKMDLCESDPSETIRVLVLGVPCGAEISILYLFSDVFPCFIGNFVTNLGQYCTRNDTDIYVLHKDTAIES